jgi:hypothetical protein
MQGIQRMLDGIQQRRVARLDGDDVGLFAEWFVEHAIDRSGTGQRVQHGLIGDDGCDSIVIQQIKCLRVRLHEVKTAAGQPGADGGNFVPRGATHKGERLPIKRIEGLKAIGLFDQGR